MSPGEVMLGGTLKADGTLDLDQKPNLSPGRVIVVLRQESGTKAAEPLGAGFFQMMEEIWSGQQARRFVSRAVEEISAERNQLQAEAAREIEAAIRLQEESRRLREQSRSEEPSP
ncbi:MAG TPA: hypothetical protein VG125_13245 [Pirellulales bacterium]|jgi:hypothetical protein|nr:hypothetical protein [Pirellulales bacterium]